MYLKKYTKKLIAPIIITVLVVCYFVFYISVGLFITDVPSIVKILMLVIPISLAILSVYMLIERIREIKGGEEDDIGKY